jgi:Type II secretion system (T2SS), protein M subtype b
MVASKRERFIAVATGVAIALFVLDSYVVEPYFDALSAASDARDHAIQKLDDANMLFARQRKLRTIWTEMQANGLRTDEAQADSQLQHALLDWAQQAGVEPPALKDDPPRKEGMFLVIGYHISASGSMRSVSRLLWALETATIPIRVSEVQITPQPEGTDHLKVLLGVSTLCAPPVGSADLSEVSQ